MNQINEICNTSETDKSIDYHSLEKLRKKIELMSKYHQIEIAKIFKTNKIHLNENNNGIFINLNTISKNIILQIQDYISFVETQENDLFKDEKKKANLENTYFKNTKTQEQSNNLI